MRSFKKALLYTALFILITACFSVGLIEPFYHSEYRYYCDAGLRRELAGTLDYLFVGASNGYAAFVPPIADAEMGVCSYNLSGGLLTWYGKRVILEKELERNPVQTVVLEISFNSLWREYHSAWGDSVFLSRLDSPAERVGYVLRHTNVKDWDHMYATLLGDSIEYVGTLAANTLLGKDLPVRNVDYALKGYHAKYESFTVTDGMRQLNPGSMDTYFVQKNVDELLAMVELCKEKGLEVLLVVVPISDYEIFRFNNWGEMEQKWRDLSAQTGCLLIDFNLLKDRYALFEDAASFADAEHLSRNGAETFTKEYAKVMNLYRSGASYADLFYPDYNTMRQELPYLKTD